VPTPSIYLHHVAIYSADRNASAAFYEKAFGFHLDYDWRTAQAGPFEFELNLVGLRSPDGKTFMEIFQADPTTARPDVLMRGVNHVALWVSDCESSYKQAMNAGGALYTGKDKNGKTWNGSPVKFVFSGTPAISAMIAFLVGPDGEVIELIQPLDGE